MSEPEFEAYLRQLAQSLGLNTNQKQSVAAELRDHLEERLQQLTEQGVPREEACQQALAEFGDVVTLAHNFTVPHHRRQRRQAVRYTLSSVAIVVTTFVMASFYWPVQRPEPFGKIVAQSETATIKSTVVEDDTDAQRASLEDKLTGRAIGLAFQDTPFVDAIEFIATELDVDILIDQPVFVDNGIDLSQPVSLKIRPGNVSAKTAIRLLLRQIGMEDSAAMVIRDGIVDLTAVERSHEVQVYNCRDLLDGVVVQRARGGMLGGLGGMMGGGGGGGMFQLPPEGVTGALTETALGQLGGGGIGSGGPDRSATTDAGAVLMDVIQQATQPAEWVEMDGAGGTITEFNGLITIGHTQQVHERVADLLKKLRSANAKLAAPAAPPVNSN